jgi:hypothetical protein
MRTDKADVTATLYKFVWELLGSISLRTSAIVTEF